MGSEEEEAYKLARYLDANYVLVIFGGVSYYSGDDISKFLWMIRIAGNIRLLSLLQLVSSLRSRRTTITTMECTE
jgi:asparagine N-glycosylation enzyme membrane subunit Stt3